MNTKPTTRHLLIVLEFIEEWERKEGQCPVPEGREAAEADRSVEVELVEPAVMQ